MEKKVPSSKKTSQTEKRLIWVVHEGLERKEQTAIEVYAYNTEPHSNATS